MSVKFKTMFLRKAVQATYSAVLMGRSDGTGQCINVILCNSIENYVEIKEFLETDSTIAFNTLLIFKFDTQLSYTPMNLAPCQRSHELRFEPGTAANRAVFKAQSHAHWTLLQ